MVLLCPLIYQKNADLCRRFFKEIKFGHDIGENVTILFYYNREML